jgi:hypothetical protein
MNSCPGIRQSVARASCTLLLFSRVYLIRSLPCVLIKVWSVAILRQWTAAAARSAPIKANASMESLELKKPPQSIERHFEVVDSENNQQTQVNISSSIGLITAPQHHLNRVKYNHDKLRKNPVGAASAANEKAQLSLQYVRGYF